MKQTKEPRISVSRLRLRGLAVGFLAIHIFLFSRLSVIAAASQSDSIKTMIAVRVENPPQIDGRLDDEIWGLAVPTSDFVQRLPNDGEPATEQTIVRVLYDDANIYFGIECLDSQPEKIEARILSRDVDTWPADIINIVLDTYHDHQSCFGFFTNPRGVLRDFQSDGDGSKGWDGINLAWDGVWWAEGRITNRGWEIEIAIPFKTLRFSRDRVQVWGVNLQRYQKPKREDTSWSPIIKDDLSVLQVSKAGHLLGLENLQQGLHLEVLPYSVGEFQKTGPKGANQWQEDIGLDLKYGITSNVTADITINPDFAQVEADEEQINLTRFELYYPEKRPFFLEGKDLFTPMGLFYSRHIRDPIFGARITGKMGDYSVGLLSAVDDETEGPNSSYHVVRLQKDIFKRSSIGVVGVGKQTTRTRYSRALGLDVRLRPWNIYEFNLDVAKSLNPGIHKNDWMTSLELGRYTRTFSVGSRLSSREPEFNVDDTGYIPHDSHIGEKELESWLEYDYWIKSHGIEKINFEQEGSATKRSDDNRWGWHWQNFDVSVRFEDRNRIFLWHSDWYLRYKQQGFRGQTFGFGYGSYGERSISPSIRVTFQDQYDWEDNYFGSVRQIEGDVKIKPSDNLTVEASGSAVWEYFPSGRFDELKQVAYLKMSYLPTRDIFLRVFIQSNPTSRQHLFSGLLSYRFRPGSRFYIAFNETREGQRFNSTTLSDRICVAKITYLWNL